jgi:hypothetical protein
VLRRLRGEGQERHDEPRIVAQTVTRQGHGGVEQHQSLDGLGVTRRLQDAQQAAHRVADQGDGLVADRPDESV